MAHCASVSLALLLCSVGLAGCKKKPPPPPPAELEMRGDGAEISENTAPPSPSPSPGPVPSRCRELPQPAPFRIGELATRRGAASDPEDGGPDDEDEVPDPYAVELGPARADAEGFVLTALRSTKGQTHALIAVVGADAASGKLIDLGVVHGDPDPPLFASHGKNLVLVTPDTDAAGGMLRVGVVRDPRGDARVNWGPEITGVRRDSTFALEVSGERALLTYAAEASGKIRVFGVLLDPNNLQLKLTPEPLSALGADVDSPRLALRNGGYWLAVARSLDAPKPKPKSHPGDAGSDLADGDSLLDIGTRRIEVTKLDAQGKPSSSALVVTRPGARPMSFELAAAADGSAYVGFRGDDTTPGAAGGALELVHVKLDGSLEKVELSGESNGPGSPSFLNDASSKDVLWLTAAGENGATFFGRVGQRSVLAADSVVRGGDLIAARDGKLLLARAKGTAAELSLLTCTE
ncbi:MAG TPA: hypothetical protein VJV79_17455 [Polyangiaceae bacterium]|nr:hypothetical protein [Polyangiaceae bacterium]